MSSFLPRVGCLCLLVLLDKTIGGFSPTTMWTTIRTQKEAILRHTTQPRLYENKSGDEEEAKESSETDGAWTRIGPPIATISSPWLTVLAERYRTKNNPTNDEDDNDNDRSCVVDYWRIQRASSVIVIVLHRNHYVLPARRTFRPGLQQCTLDFVGGRRQVDDESIVDAARRLLHKELGCLVNDHPTDNHNGKDDPQPQQEPIQFIVLNEDNDNHDHGTRPQQGWPVDSSVSNQRLYGVVAVLRDDLDFFDHNNNDKDQDSLIPVVKYPVEQVDCLLADLPCLQCRAVLLEWLYRSSKRSKTDVR